MKSDIDIRKTICQCRVVGWRDRASILRNSAFVGNNTRFDDEIRLGGTEALDGMGVDHNEHRTVCGNT